MTVNLLGPAISAWQVEQAVLSVLQTVPPQGEVPLLVYYVAEQERQNGLVPETLEQPQVYRGGSDFLTWRQDEYPAVIVVVTTPEKPERGIDATTYDQEFEVQVGVLVQGADAAPQTDARRQASLYGAAIVRCVLDNGNLGPSPYDPAVNLATATMLTGNPTPEFAVASTTSRELMEAVATFTVLVAPTFVVEGALTFTGSPYVVPGQWPDVTSFDVAFTAEPDVIP